MLKCPEFHQVAKFFNKRTHWKVPSWGLGVSTTSTTTSAICLPNREWIKSTVRLRIRFPGSGKHNFSSNGSRRGFFNNRLPKITFYSSQSLLVQINHKQFSFRVTNGWDRSSHNSVEERGESYNKHSCTPHLSQSFRAVGAGGWAPVTEWTWLLEGDASFLARRHNFAYKLSSARIFFDQRRCPTKGRECLRFWLEPTDLLRRLLRL